MKLFLTTTFMLCCALVFAQDATITNGSELTNETPDATWEQNLGSDESGYYFLNKSGPITQQKIIVEKYDLSFNLIYSKNINVDGGVMGDADYHRKTEMINGEILIFVEHWNKSKGETTYSIVKVGKDGEVSDMQTQVGSGNGKNLMKAATYRYGFSPDGSKLALITERQLVKGEKEKVFIEVFTVADLQPMYAHELTLSNERKKYPIHDITVNNAGDAYIFKDHKISNKEHEYSLITANKAGTKVQDIDLSGRYPTYHEMLIDPSGNLVISGMLADAGQYRGVWQAIWFFKAGADGAILTNSVEELGADMLKLVVNESKANTANYKLNDFVMLDALMKSDGSVLLLSENQTSTKTAVGSATPPVYNHTLNHGNLFVLSFSNDGKRQWNVLIEKIQSETTRDKDLHFGSVAYDLRDDQLYVVWNFMNIQRTDVIHGSYRYWVDANGDKINLDNLFGPECLYPPMLTVISKDGYFVHNKRTFSALPLVEIQKPNAFVMAVNPSVYIPTKAGMMIMNRMNGVPFKRYKFSMIGY